MREPRREAAWCLSPALQGGLFAAGHQDSGNAQGLRIRRGRGYLPLLPSGSCCLQPAKGFSGVTFHLAQSRAALGGWQRTGAVLCLCHGRFAWRKTAAKVSTSYWYDSLLVHPSWGLAGKSSGCSHQLEVFSRFAADFWACQVDPLIGALIPVPKAPPAVPPAEVAEEQREQRRARLSDAGGKGSGRDVQTPTVCQGCAKLELSTVGASRRRRRSWCVEEPGHLPAATSCSGKGRVAPAVMTAAAVSLPLP